ncbi:MAG: class I SAM-dependent DNA methyltransferase [Clostridiales bacterium]|nr:class I SAM-dependent DNA methyltransferase [Clostridiales bacterium]
MDDTLSVPIYLELTKQNGAPLLWVMLSASRETDAGIMESFVFDASQVEDDAVGAVYKGILSEVPNEELATKVLFGSNEPPRFLLLIGMNQIALIDRNKWNEKRYLQFELEEIFSRLENSTLQAMSVLLHKDSLCPENGKILLDELDEQSQKNASGVSQDLKYALRESIELLGNEVLYDMSHRLGRDLEADLVDAGELTLECLRYMYRMLFMLFIESRPELGYAPMKAQTYMTGYSLESLRDIADNIRDDVNEVGDGYYLHETLAKLYDLIYDGYPKTEEELRDVTGRDSLHDMFLIAPLKAHIFDPEYTRMITAARLRNSCMLRIIDLMSVTRATGRKKDRRGRISYANLGINQMGAVYEALLSYRGFIAEHDLYEVKRAGDSFNELDVGYFVSESELDQYSEEERVRYEKDDPNGKYRKGQLRMYPRGTFIYRLAGREREKSASYYTPEVLTKCLVKHALKELLEGKTADEILELTVCEPAMGSAAFLNEAINQLAEAYLSKKEQETGVTVSYEKRFQELQKIKMYIADRNVYGIDLNPVAVELAEVSLWLNTIYEGGYVPWFGTQLVNGNSLIGARRQVYRVSQLTATSKGMRWYENAPERIPVGQSRVEQRSNVSKRQVYHFLLGDPGMASYSDKVIKKLEPDAIKQLNTWNKRFNEPYTDDEVRTLLYLSAIVDELWENQIKLRRTISQDTQDQLSVFGHEDTVADSHTTIRQKDEIYSKLYKSEHMKNAGPYARLKFAMDYWCALWFWPIDQAELLPSRSEFLNDMSLILEGTFSTKKGENLLAYQQLSLFPTEQDELVSKISDLFPNQSVVDLDNLCQLFPRLALVREIAEQNHFMHWELEFADLFAERGGFDLIIGNPPWIKVTWEEKGVLSDIQPLFVIRKMSAKQTTEKRLDVLSEENTRALYLGEYVSVSAQQNYINATQNYASLKGLQGNLYECFLPQAWTFANSDGVFALIHPESVFNDSKGIEIRRELNSRMKRHYRFSNALKLFVDVHSSREFGLNIYSNKLSIGFEQIVNLFAASTIDECYENDTTTPIYIKDQNGKRNTIGQKDRITYIGRDELKLFARIMDNSDDWKSARLMSVYANNLMDVLKCFDKQKCRLSDLQDNLFVSMLWDETNAQKDGTIERKVHFGQTLDTILSGTHIGTANPLFNCSNNNCSGNNDNTSIDLNYIPAWYIQRSNYAPACDTQEYLRRIPSTPWGNKYIENYRIVGRKMVDIEGERTLMTALLPPKIGHTNGIIGFAFSDIKQLALMVGAFSSLPYDFFIKACGKGNLQMNTAGMLPLIDTKHQLANEIICRGALLNCLTEYYEEYWSAIYDESFHSFSWTKQDSRLNLDTFSEIDKRWDYSTPVRSSYSRRQLMVEIDVLVSMAIGMNFDQLLSIYRIQFPTLQQHERDTYYDAVGSIVYAKNNALTGVGFSRPEFENGIKGAPAGKKFYRTITDDTQPGGPVQRTIEYVAPFDRCDREEDYETAWKFFEEKYGEDS